MISRLLLLLTGFEGLFVIWWILQLPSEAGSARLLGLSSTRLALLGGGLIVVLFALGFFIASWVKQSWFNRAKKRLQVIADQEALSILLFILCGLGMYVGVQSAIYASIAMEPVVMAFLLRMQPFLVWFALICGQLLILLIYWRFQGKQLRQSKARDFLKIGAIFGSFLIAWLFLARTGFGFAEETPERGVFRSPGTPVLGTQVILALAVSFCIAWLWNHRNRRKFISDQISKRKIDLLCFGLIWLSAFIIWMSVPLKASWFADTPRAPNFTFSPNSDAYLYEAVGQSLLVGSGFWHPQWGSIVARPMYSALLALFHVLGGLGYVDIIPWQIAVLSIFPSLVFSLTRVLHTRVSGILAALLVILREYNAIMLADTITVSHAKLLMADLPATLGVVLILLLVVLWIKNPERNALFPLVSGAAIGFFLLIRLEVLGLIGIFALAGLCFLPGKLMNWAKGTTLAVFGFFLMIVPWVWRNWHHTNQIYLINPTYERQIIEKTLGIESENSSLDDVNIKTGARKGVLKLVLPMLTTDTQNPNDQAWSTTEKVLHHYFNSQNQAIIFLPMSPKMLYGLADSGITRQFSSWYLGCCSSEEYVRSLPYWWGDWDGSLTQESYLLMGMALFIISVGTNALWNKHKFLGLIPLLSAASYFIFLAVLGRSGGRWIQEVDWISLVVYGVGLVEIGSWVVNRVSNQKEASFLKVETLDQSPSNSLKPKFYTYVISALLILFVGAILPLLEIIIPKQYSQDEIDKRISSLLIDENDILSDEEELLLQNLLHEDISIWLGRALYPRYFENGDGMDGLHDLYKRPFSRMEFFLVGTNNHWATLAQESPVDELTHAVDVLLIGKPAHYSLSVLSAIVYDDEGGKPLAVFWDETLSNGQ